MPGPRSLEVFHEKLSYAASEYHRARGLPVILTYSCVFRAYYPEVRARILSGCLDNAILLLEEQFPSILRVDFEEVDQSQRELLSPTTRSTVTPHTVEPAHLLLNLHILSFIEAARTMSLPQRCTDPTCCRRLSAPPSPTSPHWRGTYGGQACKAQPALLKKLALLFSEAKQWLRPADRIAYLGELARVSAIICYSYPEETELAPYFSQARREAVADQIGRAILCAWTMIDWNHQPLMFPCSQGITHLSKFVIGSSSGSSISRHNRLRAMSYPVRGDYLSAMSTCSSMYCVLNKLDPYRHTPYTIQYPNPRGSQSRVHGSLPWVWAGENRGAWLRVQKKSSVPVLGNI